MDGGVVCQFGRLETTVDRDVGVLSSFFVLVLLRLLLQFVVDGWRIGVLELDCNLVQGSGQAFGRVVLQGTEKGLFERVGHSCGLGRGLDHGLGSGLDRGLGHGLDRGLGRGLNRGLDRGLDFEFERV